MNIPKQIKIGGLMYSIEKSDNMERANALGMCIPDECIIKIKKSMPHQKQCVILLHEIVHAIDFACNYGRMKDDVVDRFSEVLYQVIVDNRGMKW